MDNENLAKKEEKRGYVRGACICEAEIVVDEKNDVTEEVGVIDLAAGGLKFIASKNNSEYKNTSEHLLRLAINEKKVDMDFTTRIKIRRAEKTGNNEITYGAAFIDLTPAQRIRIDELIQLKMRADKQGLVN